MTGTRLLSFFDLSGQVAVVTGGTGVLGGAMARGLAHAGARVAVLGRRSAQADTVVAAIGGDGGEALAAPADVLDPEGLQAARDRVVERWGGIDILVNAAGGTTPASTTGPDVGIFDLSPAAVREVVDLNLLGTLLPCQIFGAVMAAREPEKGSGRGSIVNISSMSAQRPLSRVGAYGAAKAGVENLTRWLAVELSRTYGPGLRVNAIAPGFFLGEQNRALLVKADGSLTPRGQAVIEHTPAGRFGEPDELVGTLIWLCSPSAAFVNGVVVPVDGGFSAASGV